MSSSVAEVTPSDAPDSLSAEIMPKAKTSQRDNGCLRQSSAFSANRSRVGPSCQWVAKREQNPTRLKNVRELVAEYDEIDFPEGTPDEVKAFFNDKKEGRNQVDTRKRCVTFNVIEIREYSRCLGDHPVASKGPPMAIDWRYREAGSFGVDEYEKQKHPARTSSEFMMPGSTRSRILKEHAGVTDVDIKAKMSEMNQVKHERQMSIAMQEVEEWTIIYESLKRKTKRLFARVSKKKEKDILEEKAVPVLLVKEADSNQEKTIDQEMETSELVVE